MKKLAFLIAVSIGLYYYFTWIPSTTSVVREMEFGDNLSHEGNSFQSIWGESESIVGYARRIDRHYDKNMPIITFDVVITTEEFNDPDIVTVKHKGGGNYYWSAKTQPKGTIIFYHTVPNSTYAQGKLDDLEEGDTVEILGSISTNSEIRSDSGAFVKLLHDNHKIILVDDVL